VRALARHYREKPYLLLCHDASFRRAQGSTRIEGRRPLHTPEDQLAAYGGAHTAYNFPNFAQDFELGSKFLVSSYGAETKHFAIERHGRGVNFVFFDQHVSAVRPARELWALKWHKSYQRHGHERTENFPAWMR